MPSVDRTDQRLGSQKRFVKRRRFLATGGVALGMLLAGCSDSGTSSQQTTDGHDEGGSDHGENESGDHANSIGTPVEEASVEMVSNDDGHHFEPHVVHVETGGTVTWTDESGSHSATAYASDNDNPQRIPDDAAAWDSGRLGDGETFQHTFETPGVYDYFCIPHEAVGMVATVVVGDADIRDQPGLASPQDGLPEKAKEKIEELNATVTEALE